MKITQILILTMLLVTGCNGQQHHGKSHDSHSAKNTASKENKVGSETIISFPTVGYKVVYKDIISFPINRVFPLFEPQGRTLLYDNWNPTLLREGKNGTLEGQVLFSKYDELDVMLTVTEYDSEKGHIQYLVVWDDFEIQRIDIYCKKGERENSTAVTWIEHNAGLYEKGVPLVRMFVEEGFLVKAVQRYINNIKNRLDNEK
ncbi:hypothetical protein [Dokdonia sp.]|uniref:hypothetical protein n=1 Tax=Dokdonia sp. TaxID=2024995 RepID=UPI00326390E9